MPRQSVTILELTFTAPGAVAARRAVTFAGAQATVEGSKVVGVAKYAAATGEPYSVGVCGTVVVDLGGTVAVGDALMVDTQGRGVVATGTNYVFADALGAGASGEAIEVLLRR